MGADGASGAVDASEFGQTWADVGGFDHDETCIVGGDQWKTDRAELAGGGLKTTGAKKVNTEVPISEVTQWGVPRRKYVCWVDGVLKVHYGNCSFRAATKEAGGGVDDAHTGLGDADSDEARQRGILTGAAKASKDLIWSGDGAAFSGEVFRSGALECESSMRRSGRKADHVQHDWNGGAERALPKVDRSGPAVMERVGGLGLWTGFAAGMQPLEGLGGDADI